MGDYFTFEDIMYVFNIDDPSKIDSKYITGRDENGLYLSLDDNDNNGVPDFVDSYFGADVDLNPSQGVVIG